MKRNIFRAELTNSLAVKEALLYRSKPLDTEWGALCEVLAEWCDE